MSRLAAAAAMLSVESSAVSSCLSCTVTSRAALTALDPTRTNVAFLSEDGRDGVFEFQTGDFSAAIDRDPLGGIYIKADDVASTAGAWIRQFTGPVAVDWFGAGKPGADDTAAWKGALAASHHVTARRGATYHIKGTLGAPLDGATIDLNGSTIIADWKEASGQYEAVFFIDGQDNVTIRNGKIEFTGRFNSGGSYAGLVSGIHANNADKLTVESMEITGFNRCGIVVGLLVSGPTPNCQSPKVINCHLHHNRVAGAVFGFTRNGLVQGCDLRWNGHASDPGTGYGFAGWSSGLPVNTSLIGNNASDNYRKGLDFHSGHDGVVSGNTCARNGIFGIFVEGVSGTWSITGNIVKDMLWDGRFRDSTMFGIAVGHLTGQGTRAAPTSFVISGNTISNFRLTDGSAAALYLMGRGLSYGKFMIADNVFDLGKVTHVVNTASGPSRNFGKWYDVAITGNEVTCEECTGIPFVIRGNTNRKKTFANNRLEIRAAGASAGVFVYESTLADGHTLVATGNDLSVPPAAWREAHDPIRVRRTAHETVKGNWVNGTSWRDWDGAGFISRGSQKPALPSSRR
ncbi:hypothetical protein GRI75_01285 [Altererythrobacter soli]|uniref:Right handed beta helix domain-containing protein n=1 Tax=Croceibacterium soli TaxID=1739690 RepID=A0A6I4UPC2_9SPHN|nr:right-handed parallel beta-helix repeat-containing protein [Croceibacterium soli]MXP40276.1 hypothetical protein [Croceibacterium soli]